MPSLTPGRFVGQTLDLRATSSQRGFPSRRASAIGMTGWTPANVRGLQFWLDAADTPTITESSGKVSQWNDKSGYGRHVAQATSSAQPTTGSVTKNGLNVLSFDGGDYLAVAQTLMGTRCTMTCAVNCTSTGLGGRVLSNNGSPNTQMMVYPYPGIDSAVLFAGANLYSAANSVVVSTWYVVTFALDGTQSRIWVNGAPGAVGDPGTQEMGLAVVGASNANGLPFTGYIAEIVFANVVLNDPERRLLEQHLRTKWAI